MLNYFDLLVTMSISCWGTEVTHRFFMSLHSTKELPAQLGDFKFSTGEGKEKQL